MTSDPTDAPKLNSLPHPDDESILATARDALLTGMSNVFIVSEEEFHIDACFLALYHQLKREPRLRLHRMMSPKIDDRAPMPPPIPPPIPPPDPIPAMSPHASCIELYQRDPN